MDISDINNTGNDIKHFFQQSDAFSAIIILFIALIVAYWLSQFLAKGIIRIAQAVSTRADAESDEERLVKYRQIETYLSVAVAAVRAIVVAIVAYYAWQLLFPDARGSNTGIAAIGASTIFVVFAGQSVGILLRDFTAGATMIIEQWFNVGDFIKIEPFADVSGVVERLTLRSTRLRRLSGEIVYIHNQQIAAVHVTPRGVRTLAVDIFVKDRTVGEKAIEDIIANVPTGPTMLARPLRIKYTERWNDTLWRITVVGQTPPGREWLIEKFFVNALKEIDEDKPKAERIIIQEPIARYADTEADNRFKRAIRVNKDK
jgi:small-conductance mechanosensitive channel